jgi:hypothetical protein
MNDMNVITTITIITAVVGAACGIAGLVLGIINTWAEAQHNKVRLKIVPGHAFPVGDGDEPPVFNFRIEVINLSEFPVTIDEVGFRCSNHSSLIPLGDKVYCRFFSTPLPCRLEPHASCTEFYLLDESVIAQSSQYGGVKGAYARTQCGTLVKGTSPALRQVIGELDHGK